MRNIFPELRAWISLALLLQICGAGPATAADKEYGVTATSIVLGQSAALSGPAKRLGIEMRDGAKAYFDYINAQGGVFGRRIILKTIDDGYESDKALANTKLLIEREAVFSLFGYVGTPTSNAALPLAIKAQIPFFAPMTGAQSLREPYNRNIFHIRASYFAETEKIVEHIMALNLRRVAVFFQNDAYGRAGLEGVTRALSERGLGIVASSTVERNSIDVASAISAIKQVQPDVIILVSAYASSAAFIKKMKTELPVPPYFWNISFVGTQALSNELGKYGRGVMISQVVPAPWDTYIPIVNEYLRIYARHPGNEPGFVSLEGFIAAKIFVEGLRRAGSKLSRDGFLRAMESMREHDVGGFKVKFSPGNHKGSDFIGLTVIGENGKLIN